MSAQSADKATDSLQRRLIEYTFEIEFADLPAAVVHAAKIRFIDILGVLIGGFFGAPCATARKLAQTASQRGATIIGTRRTTALDMAGFVNGATARYLEMNDAYHKPGVSGAHPSDMLPALLSAAEFSGADGRAFITASVLAYEVYLRINDKFHNMGFDHTNHCCLGVAVAGGRLVGLTPAQLAQCISMAVVPNMMLRQVRGMSEHLSMFKAVATGQASRAALFAAMLARAGMEGPHLPFEGKAGWFDHIARERFMLDAMGGRNEPYKILETLLKNRQSAGVLIAPILAAEKAAGARISDIAQVHVEVHKRAKDNMGTGAHRWNPETKESADHSVPYVVAAVLMDGTISLRSYDDAHLRSPELRALMRKTEVVENPEFTRMFNAVPQQHCARVTVITKDGKRSIGETGGDEDDMATPMTDQQVEDKFRSLTEDVLGAGRVRLILDRLNNLENERNMADIPPLFVLA